MLQMKRIKRKWRDWGLVALATLTLVSVFWGIAAQTRVTPEAQSMGSTAPWPAASASASASARPFTPMNDAIARLEDTSRPWTMTVIGDSTGADQRWWVQEVVADLAQRTGRPAEVHWWSTDHNAYQQTTTLEGNGEPIIVWNGSALGHNAGYSLDHRKALAPERPDVLIVNHGHNQASAEEAVTEIRTLLRWARAAWSEPPSLAITLQNIRTDNQAEKHEQVVDSLRHDWDKAESVVLVDVFSAFRSAEDLPSIMSSDGVHPTEKGQVLWADVVAKALGFDRLGS